MMSGFRRSHSKVWWASYFHERDHTEDDREGSSPSLSPALLQFNGSRRRSTDESNSDRNSSRSPSDGSHRSQDSGFSDSESSTPSNCSSKAVNSENHSASDGNHEITPEASTFRESSSRLPETPINRIPRLVVIKPKPNESTSSDELHKLEQEQTNNLVSTYLAECYFPITTLIEGSKSPYTSQLPQVLSCPSPCDNSDKESSISSQSSYEMNSKSGNKRTCFIVGETPKKIPVKSDSSSLSYDDTNESTMEGSYSLSYDDTVRFVENKECQSDERECINEPKSVLPPIINTTYKISGPSESRPSSPEFNHLNLPAPTFTSTPKKDLQIRMNKKLRDPPDLTKSKPELEKNNQSVK